MDEHKHEYDHDQERFDETSDADEKLTYTLGGITTNIFCVLFVICITAIMFVVTAKLIHWIWFL